MARGEEASLLLRPEYAYTARLAARTYFFFGDVLLFSISRYAYGPSGRPAAGEGLAVLEAEDVFLSPNQHSRGHALRCLHLSSPVSTCLHLSSPVFTCSIRLRRTHAVL